MLCLGQSCFKYDFYIQKASLTVREITFPYDIPPYFEI